MNTNDDFEITNITKPPILSLEYIRKLVKDHYGLVVSSIGPLFSYDDLNVLVKLSNENGKLSSRKCVLKILNSHDSKKVDLILAQNKMVLHLDHVGLSVPTPLENLSGATITYVNLSNYSSLPSDNNTEYLVRLLNYIDGNVIVSVPYTPHLMYQFGHFVAKVNLLLKDFDDVAIKQRTRYRWMLESVPNISSEVIKDVRKKEIIDQVIRLWISDVKPRLKILEKGYVHGDMNEKNVLVAVDELDEHQYNISGLLDFSDVCYTAYIFELAIAIAYMMLDSTIVSPLDIPGYIIAGYMKARHIPDIEWNILLECICARYAQSIIIGTRSCQEEPENEYKLSVLSKVWATLGYLLETPKPDLLRRWREIADGYSTFMTVRLFSESKNVRQY